MAREVERGTADQARKREQRHFMARALECFATSVAFVDVSLPGWRAMHCSPAFSTVCLCSASFCTVHLPVLGVLMLWPRCCRSAARTLAWGMQREACLKHVLSAVPAADEAALIKLVWCNDSPT